MYVCVGEGGGGRQKRPPDKIKPTAMPSTGDCIECSTGRYDHDRDASTLCEVCGAGTESSSTGGCAACPAGKKDHDPAPGPGPKTRCVDCNTGECVPGVGQQ